MKRTWMGFFWVFAGGLGAGCIGGGDLFSEIPMIGFDEKGQAVQIMVSEAEYSEKVTQSMAAIQDSLAPALARQQGRSNQDPSQSPSWMLRTFLVGTGVNMEIGVEPLIKVGVFPRFRMVFTNSIDPTIP